MKADQFRLYRNLLRPRVPLASTRWNDQMKKTSFHAFDLLRLNGKDLQGLPIEEGKTKLEALLKKPPGVIRYSVSFTENIEELLSRSADWDSKA
jgi:ATP-dependent DNA ligase